MGIKIESKNQCPLDGFKPCRQTDCAWFTQIRGVNPNTGGELDEWACSIAWMPVLLINTANESRQTAAAVESFRNEMVDSNNKALALAVVASQTPRIKP